MRVTGYGLLTLASLALYSCSEEAPLVSQQKRVIPSPQALQFLEALDFTTASNLHHNRNLQARFTNIDNGSLITQLISYFDGAIDTYTNYQYNGNTLISSTTYSHPGPDGIWLNDDDMIKLFVDEHPSQEGVDNILYYDPGPDQIWHTSDDKIKYYTSSQADVANNKKYTIVKSIIGADNVWFSADDINGWIIEESSPTTEFTNIAIYTGAGDDGDWFATADNLVYQHARKLFDATGKAQRHILYQDTGTDKTAFTDDDTVLYYHDYFYDIQGRLESIVMYFGGPGADNNWFTPDDIVYTCKQQQRDVNDLPIRTVTWRPGGDQACFTHDDLVWGYHDDVFDTNKQLIESHAYYGIGTDATWFTPDDLIVSQRFYTPKQ